MKNILRSLKNDVTRAIVVLIIIIVMFDLKIFENNKSKYSLHLAAVWPNFCLSTKIKAREILFISGNPGG